eukprot:TRINITY_DN37097_c0_g1_i1.p1 TRINITY_DN37097_c0_g1~~TRINITY_DN37097_c0_g1_i1.p1  ORF type:complete len:525 (-),score=106.71 TRINITY_DN37097_c0_g1_i1:137-1648(-)
MAPTVTKVLAAVGALLALASGAAEIMLADDRCPHYDLGTPSAGLGSEAAAAATLRGSVQSAESEAAVSKAEYYERLKTLDIQSLYESIETLMTTSQSCWPADGPQDGDSPSYAGLFGRLAWHCAGTFRLAGGEGAVGGCEGGRMRFWPENQWRDNVNLDKARALLGQVKAEFGANISWGDLMTFAGTVGIKASGGRVKKFCFGRVDEQDGQRSVKLGVEGVNVCDGADCASHAPCKAHFRWPEQDDNDNFRCNLTQPDGRLQASHSVGLIYVYPEGPQLKPSAAGYDSTFVHNRSPKLSAQEVRDTFELRMGWSARETVALIGGGHTLGRTHGNCDLSGTTWAAQPYNGVGPYFEAVPGSGRGPTDGTCGSGSEAGLGPNTVSSGFDGPWTRTPSKWNYDYFEAMVSEDWVPTKSPFGNDQWMTKDKNSKYAHTRRLTADLALMADEKYKEIATEYANDYYQFDEDFAAAWFKLMHRSENHPHQDDLEKDAGVCTQFEFLSNY